MKTGTLALLAVGGLGVYYFAQLGTAGATVQFVFEGFSFQSLTQLQIQVLVQNVSNANINFEAMAGTVSIVPPGQSTPIPLGNVSYFPPAPTQILPTSQTPVNLTANISLFSLPSAIQDLINNVQGAGTYTIQIDGNANVNTLVIPFTLKYPVTI